LSLRRARHGVHTEEATSTKCARGGAKKKHMLGTSQTTLALCPTHEEAHLIGHATRRVTTGANLQTSHNLRLLSRGARTSSCTSTMASRSLLSWLLLSPLAAAAWQPPVFPAARAPSRGLAAPMLALGGRASLPPAALEVSNRFKKRYEPKQLDPIWRALRQCYGSEELALQAVSENPQILNPSYSRPERIQASKACLVEIMGEADTLEVMLKNPAVLQCGSALAGAQASEIKGFATLRFVGNRCAHLPAQPPGAAQPPGRPAACVPACLRACLNACLCACLNACDRAVGAGHSAAPARRLVAAFSHWPPPKVPPRLMRQRHA